MLSTYYIAANCDAFIGLTLRLVIYLLDWQDVSENVADVFYITHACFLTFIKLAIYLLS